MAEKLNILLHIVSTNRKYVLNRPDNHLYNIQYTAQIKLDIKFKIILVDADRELMNLVIDLKFRLGEACSHIGALLFLIAEQVASGKNLPDDLSATDQLCAWKDSKSKNFK
jgi:hypothetical protein